MKYSAILITANNGLIEFKISPTPSIKKLKLKLKKKTRKEKKKERKSSKDCQFFFRKLKRKVSVKKRVNSNRHTLRVINH